MSNIGCRLQHPAYLHMWAHVAAWLADPNDASDLYPLRGACQLTLRAFDVAVHAGWVALAAHADPDSSADDEEDGATCRWLGGWVPVDFKACGEAKCLKGMAVRLEHRLVPASRSPAECWPAGSVIVCETLQPAEGSISVDTSVVAKCDPKSLSFRLADTTTAIGTTFVLASNLGHLSTIGLHRVQSIPPRFIHRAQRLVEFDGAGLTSVTVIGDHFLEYSPWLKTVSLSACVHVTSVGESFCSNCPRLTSIDLSGFGLALKAIGRNCCWNCPSLRSFDLPNPTSVTVVEGAFLNCCNSLQTMNLTGFCNATCVQYSFLFGNKSLTTVDLSPLANVTTINDVFLAECRSLMSVDLSMLTGVMSIPSEFLCKCSSLTTVDISGFTNVTEVSDDFVSECEALTHIDLRPFANVTTIGNQFLQFSRALPAVDLSGMTKVTRIGGSFLLVCGSLRSVDLSPMVNLTAIVGEHSLSSCDALTTVNLGGLANLTSIAYGFLRGNDALERAQVHTDDQTSAVLHDAVRHAFGD